MAPNVGVRADSHWKTIATEKNDGLLIEYSTPWSSVFLATLLSIGILCTGFFCLYGIWIFWVNKVCRTNTKKASPTSKPNKLRQRSISRTRRSQSIVRTGSGIFGLRSSRSTANTSPTSTVENPMSSKTKKLSPKSAITSPTTTPTTVVEGSLPKGVTRLQSQIKSTVKKPVVSGIGATSEKSGLGEQPKAKEDLSVPAKPIFTHPLDDDTFSGFVEVEPMQLPKAKSWVTVISPSRVSQINEENQQRQVRSGFTESQLNDATKSLYIKNKSIYNKNTSLYNKKKTPTIPQKPPVFTFKSTPDSDQITSTVEIRSHMGIPGTPLLMCKAPISVADAMTSTASIRSSMGIPGKPLPVGKGQVSSVDSMPSNVDIRSSMGIPGKPLPVVKGSIGKDHGTGLEGTINNDNS